MSERRKRRLFRIGQGLAGICAGLIVGLGHVGAAVKFTAQKPSTFELLDVGRVQFGALHLAESVLVPVTVLLSLFGGRWHKVLALITLSCYLTKSLLVQPALHDRMLQRLSGEVVRESNLHYQYIVTSAVLVLLLTALAFLDSEPAKESCPREQAEWAN
ncbi:MAG: hypothetical protein JNK63_00905 [Chthonomonas sp.]|nr:hypothetical protein [Chthonomonas sp.]